MQRERRLNPGSLVAVERHLDVRCREPILQLSRLVQAQADARAVERREGHSSGRGAAA